MPTTMQRLEEGFIIFCIFVFLMMMPYVMVVITTIPSPRPWKQIWQVIKDAASSTIKRIF